MRSTCVQNPQTFLFMDVEALISAIFRNSAIWDKRSKFYSNRQVVDRAWKDISKELEQDESAIRRKWKYLRDNFAVEYSKRLVSRPGDGAYKIHTSKWQYFQQLLFLKDIICPRAFSGPLSHLNSLHSLQSPEDNQCAEKDQNAHDFSSIDTLEDRSQMATTSRDNVSDSESPSLCSENVHFPIDEEPEDVKFNIISGHPNEVQASHLSAPPARKRNRGHDHYFDKLIECEERKLQCLFSKSRSSEDDDSDLDLMFFKTLIPHVRMIPQNQKLEFQSKIQAVVQEFAYSKQAETATQSPYV